MTNVLQYPFDAHALLRKKKALKKELLGAAAASIECRVAILGGSTTAEIKDILELFLLQKGLRPVFYESAYNRFFEEAVFENKLLDDFGPQFVFIHSGIVNIESYPKYSDTENDAETAIRATIEKYSTLWARLSEKYHCEIIQNNFELPHTRPLGSYDCVDHRGRVNFIVRLNAEFSSAARRTPFLHIADVQYLSYQMGLQEWFDPSYWFLFKYSLSHKAITFLCNDVSNIIGAVYGKSKKLIVVDLDNTLWGGVVGDVGVLGLQLGNDDPLGEAYAEFQRFLKNLKNRGIMLAICSKNERASALEGLSHPASVLKDDDFSLIKTSWEPKDIAIKKIAEELNIALDSIVFIDDNPAERDLVRMNLPGVDVPSIGDDVTKYPEIIDRCGFFETISLLTDDLKRTEYYNKNTERIQTHGKFANHGDYLLSLEMNAEIGEFNASNLDRITQLTNKTNQFNTTVKRYSLAQLANTVENPNFIGLYGKLRDKFGDNGLVSVMLGRKGDKSDIHLDLWVMSCRVFGREMEFAMFDEFVGLCAKEAITTIFGYYFPSAKNKLVSDLYSQLGFEKQGEAESNGTVWKFMAANEYEKKSDKIKIEGSLHGHE